MDDSDLAQGTVEAPARAGTIDILYFARLKEVLGLGAERMMLPQAIATAGALRAHLQARGGAWAVELAAERPVRVAVNQVMAGADAHIHPGDEVAFFPPVTGG
ncbi:MAG TPA: molybdopterin converting factor subunit 1 [Burkholderiales bacterium]|nr:molybdopterin converting factor subunit 1 [Burkholderiales bacterium]